MSTTRHNTMLSSHAPAPFRAGEYPMPHHTFEDFAMPCVYALIHTDSTYDVKTARIYTPNPWYPDTVHFYDWMLFDDGIWRRHQGGSLTVEAAREDWKSRKAKGHTPRDVIENPLNDDFRDSWDIFADHFCPHGSYGFHELIRSYKYDYPRKAN
jgi:hypothetical protein